MFGINEIINMFINRNNLSQEQKFKILKIFTVSPEVIAYLIHKLERLKIEILDKYEGNVMELMKKELLEGWCWQTTETSVIFLNDDDYVERGNLHFENDKLYYHSWINFKYKNIDYVFDPCLNILCKRNLYLKIFTPEIKTKIFSKTIRTYLIDSIKNSKPKEQTENSKRAEEFMKKFFGSAYEKQKEYKTVETFNDVNAPMYRHNTGYKLVMEDNKILTLTAHYYRNDG